MSQNHKTSTSTKTVVHEEAAIQRFEDDGGPAPLPSLLATPAIGGPLEGLPDLARPTGPQRGDREARTVADIMTKSVRAVTPETTLSEVAVVMRSENVGVVPVVDPQNRVLGLVTDRDIVVRGLAGAEPHADVRVRSVMTDSPSSVLASATIIEALELMGQVQVRRLPVVSSDQHLVGIVSLGDIATRADYQGELRDALVKISGGRSFWAMVWR